MYFSYNLKKLRTQKLLTQEQLSKELNVSSKVISSWENKRTEPDILSLKKISEYFETTVDDLISHNLADSNQLVVSESKKSSRLPKIFITVQLILICLMYFDSFQIVNFTGTFVLAILSIFIYSIYRRKVKIQNISFINLIFLPFSLFIVNLLILFIPIISDHVTAILISNTSIMLNGKVYYILSSVIISMSEFSIISTFFNRKI